jgi:hypothetical protein
MLSSGYTDKEIIDKLKLNRSTYYKYKARVYKAFGNIAKQKTHQTIEMEASILKDRYIRLFRTLELRIADRNERLGDTAYAAEVASQIGLAILRLETEGLKYSEQKRLEQDAKKALIHNVGRDNGSARPNIAIQGDAPIIEYDGSELPEYPPKDQADVY